MHVQYQYNCVNIHVFVLIFLTYYVDITKLMKITIFLRVDNFIHLLIFCIVGVLPLTFSLPFKI